MINGLGIKYGIIRFIRQRMESINLCREKIILKNPYETYFIAEGDQLMTLSRYVEDVVVYTLYKKVQ